MAYHDQKCDRCGRVFMTSGCPSLCPTCYRRRANGKRLAADNRERIAYERQEARRSARQMYADMSEIPLSEVPAWIDDSEV